MASFLVFYDWLELILDFYPQSDRYFVLASFTLVLVQDTLPSRFCHLLTFEVSYPWYSYAPWSFIGHSSVDRIWSTDIFDIFFAVIWKIYYLIYWYIFLSGFSINWFGILSMEQNLFDWKSTKTFWENPAVFYTLRIPIFVGIVFCTVFWKSWFLSRTCDLVTLYIFRLTFMVSTWVGFLTSFGGNWRS